MKSATWAGAGGWSAIDYFEHWHTLKTLLAPAAGWEALLEDQRMSSHFHGSRVAGAGESVSHTNLGESIRFLRSTRTSCKLSCSHVSLRRP
eukprot:357494-Chlamydomonas_euryale.AAC.5